VSFSIAYAGSWCQVSGSLATNTSRGIKVQSVRFATGIAAGFVSGCGQTVSNVTPTPVMIRFTVPAAATAGNYLAVSDAGVTAVATEDYLTASCPLAP
jgi:hypothetical protein